MAAVAPFIAQAVVTAAVSYAVSSLLAPDVEGPRLQDRGVQNNAYGADLAFVYGSMLVTGSLVWLENNELKERKREESGKGGPTVTTYTYSFTGATAFHDGPCCGVRRVWADNTLVFSYYDSNLTIPENHAVSDLSNESGVSAWTDFSS